MNIQGFGDKTIGELCGVGHDIEDEEEVQALFSGHNATPVRVVNTDAAIVQARRETLAKRDVHNEPSLINRLFRLCEELLERDDVRMDADNAWYVKQLKVIKEEFRAAVRGKEAGSQSPSASEVAEETRSADTAY